MVGYRNGTSFIRHSDGGVSENNIRKFIRHSDGGVSEHELDALGTAYEVYQAFRWWGIGSEPPSKFIRHSDGGVSGINDGGVSEASLSGIPMVGYRNKWKVVSHHPMSLSGIPMVGYRN